MSEWSCLLHGIPSYPAREITLTFRRIGEIIGGSQREERHAVLIDRMKECGLNPEDYWWYLELRQ